MAFSQDLYVEKLKRTIKNIERNPDKRNDLCKEYVTDVFDFLRRRIEDVKQEVILMTIYNLYSADTTSLYKDLAKIKIADMSKDASVKERFELLRCLVDTLELYFKGDYSAVFNQLANAHHLAEVMKDTDEDDRLPFN